VLPLATNTNAGLLSKYETGTFTPTLVDVGSGATYTYTLDYADYVRINDLVHVYFSFSGINTVGTPNGAFGIRDLKYTPTSSKYYHGSCQLSGSNTSFYSVTPVFTTIGGADALLSIQTSLDGATGFVGALTITSGTLRISGTYMTTEE